MELTRLADRGNFRQVEEEWQYEFTVYVLINLGIPEDILEGCFPENMADFTVEHKMELKRHLKKNFITIVDDRDGGLKFYLEVQEDDKREFVLVADWKKCRFNYRADPTEVDPKKQMYVEVIADVWTIFEELEEE
ncbi:hypothetical protein LCGC14_0427130 [marine sediment metagenome]|uniref:Uncharacterized protein n=1 Tax=marine sediment metagenome TaxID=412755 RepID=A0A0F9VBA5_9ZZZZ